MNNSILLNADNFKKPEAGAANLKLLEIIRFIDAPIISFLDDFSNTPAFLKTQKLKRYKKSK